MMMVFIIVITTIFHYPHPRVKSSCDLDDCYIFCWCLYYVLSFDYDWEMIAHMIMNLTHVGRHSSRFKWKKIDYVLYCWFCWLFWFALLICLSLKLFWIKIWNLFCNPKREANTSFKMCSNVRQKAIHSKFSL